jgi:D-alanine-D-alanine ligase
MSPAKLKIAILYDIWEEEEQAPPPEEPAKPRKGRARKKKKHKEDREEIFEALEKLGHEPFYQVLEGTRQSLISLSRCGADLIFNLTESYAGDDTKDMSIAGYLDLLGVPYTGTGPRGLFLGQDKAVAKKLFQFHGVRTPFFAMVYKGMLDHSHDIGFPLIVKPSNEDGSIGIDSGSVVDSVKELMERIHYIHEEFDSPALIEEYIEGREIYGAVLGNGNPEVLPLIELDLSKLPKGAPRVACQEVKFERDTDAYKLTKSAPAEDLDEETAELLQSTARQAFQALKFRDYGRIDMRLREKKREVYVIEANPNPWLASGQEFAMAAKKSGRNYSQLISEIVDLAWARYHQ